MHSEILLRLTDSFDAQQESMSFALEDEAREIIEASARANGVETEDEIRQLLATPVSLHEINFSLLKQIRSDQKEILKAISAAPRKPKK